MSALRSFWDHQVLRPATTAHRLQVADRAVLFDDRAQQLLQPNDSAAAIWDALACESTPAGAAKLLVGTGDDYQLALDYVRAAAAGWLRAGLLRPAALDAPPPAPPQEIRLGWMDRRLALDLHDAAFLRPLREVFSAFLTDEASDARLTLQRLDDQVFVTDDRGWTRARSQDEWLPEVKARFTTRLLETATPGFLVHGALLAHGERGLLVCGEPGAGKTTLSVSLTAAGFAYHADDIVWIGENGDAVGAPFAPALKEGSWPLVAEMGVEAPMSAIGLRGDGQRVKYLLTPAAPPAPLWLGAILLLDRQADGPAAIEPIHPLEALTTILGCAYSARAAISASALTALAQVTESARVGRLRFSDWRDAQRLVSGFVA